jgi:multidrug efflux pump subunit AcrB
MATAVPLSMISAFAVVRYLGIELEQFSIASLIIALGMVVDNAIVVSDNAVRLIREGRRKIEAVASAAHDLAIPILSSTLTTIVAFLPMLTITGDVGEYIVSLPVVVATTLIVSYVVAILVTPILCLWLLKSDGSEESTGRRAARWLRRYDSALAWCLARPGKVVAATGVAFLARTSSISRSGCRRARPSPRHRSWRGKWKPYWSRRAPSRERRTSTGSTTRSPLSARAVRG